MQKTFIFTGCSGVGKGTQADLLNKYLKKNNSEMPVIYQETGSLFREFIKKDGYVYNLSRVIYEKGDRQPDFIAIFLWARFLMNNLKGNEHLIIDGSPRSLEEAKLLDTALTFYKRDPVYIVFLNGSRDWSTQLLTERGRSDDTPDGINERLNWCDTDVVPAIDYYRNHPHHTFLDINAEQSVEEVHNEILEKIKNPV